MKPRRLRKSGSVSMLAEVKGNSWLVVLKEATKMRSEKGREKC